MVPSTRALFFTRWFRPDPIFTPRYPAPVKWYIYHLTSQTSSPFLLLLFSSRVLLLLSLRPSPRITIRPLPKSPFDLGLTSFT